MAFAVEITKIKEENNWVYYHYRSLKRDVKFGQVKINESNGDVVLIENAELDETGAEAKRASWKLMQYWRKGEYPEEAFWES